MYDDPDANSRYHHGRKHIGQQVHPTAVAFSLLGNQLLIIEDEPIEIGPCAKPRPKRLIWNVSGDTDMPIK